MKRDEALRILSEHKHELRKRFGVKSIAIFGSTARDEAEPDSDVDVLVELEAGRSLFDLTRAQHLLEDAFGCDVDVVSSNGMTKAEIDRLLSLEPVDELTRIMTRVKRLAEEVEGVREFLHEIEFVDFVEDQLLNAATLHRVTVAGETGKRIPESFRRLYPTIPWIELIAVGDVAIEQYYDLDLKAIWNILHNRILPSRDAIQHLVENQGYLSANMD